VVKISSKVDYEMNEVSLTHLDGGVDVQTSYPGSNPHVRVLISYYLKKHCRGFPTALLSNKRKTMNVIEYFLYIPTFLGFFVSYYCIIISV
jgi:hypothetical protein